MAAGCTERTAAEAEAQHSVLGLELLLLLGLELLLLLGLKLLVLLRY